MTEPDFDYDEAAALLRGIARDAFAGVKRDKRQRALEVAAAMCEREARRLLRAAAKLPATPAEATLARVRALLTPWRTRWDGIAKKATAAETYRCADELERALGDAP